MLISTVQFKTDGTEDIPKRGLYFIERALERKPDFIVVHELFTTVYFPKFKARRYFELAEEIPGDTTERIFRLIKGTDTTVIASLFEKDGDEYYISAAVIDGNEGMVGIYRKLHIPTVGGLHETYYFTPGNYGHRIFKLKKASFGIMLCYDRHFPESARLYGLGDVDILFISASTPKGARAMWFAELQAHAFSNAYALACSNRTGTEGGIEFLGSSFICDYRGNILARAGEDGDEIVMAEINIDEGRKVRREHNFYRDRRPELYSGIVE